MVIKNKNTDVGIQVYAINLIEIEKLSCERL
jgi:hypothetical protein